MQSPGKEQEAEHAVHQGLVEINLPKKTANAHPQARENRFCGDDDERAEERHHQGPTRGGQLQDTVVHVAGDGGHRDQDGGDVKGMHAPDDDSA